MITENNEPVGTLNRDQIIAALSERGEIQMYALQWTRTNLFGCRNLAEDIFELVSVNKSNLMLVMENGLLVGTLDTENLLEFLLIKGVKSR
jgi:hypothetical protein